MIKTPKTGGCTPPDISNDQLALFISGAPVAVAMLDSNMRYVAWSEVWADRFGTGGHDLVGLCYDDIFPDLPVHFMDAYRRALSGEEVSSDGDRLELVEGRPTWERWRIKPVKDKQGDVVGTVIFTEDITEQKMAEEKLRANVSRLHLVIEALGAGLVEWDIKTGKTTASPRFSRMLGLNDSNLPTDLEGWVQLMKPVDEDAFRQALSLALYPKRSGVFRIGTAQTVSGKLRKMRLVGQTLFDEEEENEGKKPSGFIAILLDETEWMDLQTSLDTAQNLESIGRITGIIAHDFNNLLSVILANVELAKLRVSDPRTNELLQSALNEAEMGGAFNKKLMALSGQRESIPQLIRLDDHIRRIWVMFERLLNEHVTLKFAPGADDVRVRVDPAELDGALLNLLVNARDAQPQGGTITIATKVVEFDASTAAALENGSPGKFLEISVSDTGIGMTTSEIARAQEPFFSNKALGRGAGLGLTSVANAMARVHGFMSIQSKPGQGTTVSLFMPVADAHPAERGRRVVTPMGNGELVLVVEDDDMVRHATLNRLEALGYAVIEASNGQAALAVLKEGEPVDLVFSDIMMPGEVSGFDLEDAVRAQYPEIAVLLTTGHTSKRQKGQLKGNRNAGVLKKPYSLATLAQAVARELRSPRRQE